MFLQMPLNFNQHSFISFSIQIYGRLLDFSIVTMPARKWSLMPSYLVTDRIVIPSFVPADNKKLSDVECRARLQTRTRRKCVQAWRKLLDKDFKEEHFLNPPFNAWRKLAENRRDSKKQLRNRVSKLDRSSLARSFHAFEELIQDRRRLQSVVSRHMQKKDRHLMHRCFQGWISFMQVGCRFHSLSPKLLESMNQRTCYYTWC